MNVPGKMKAAVLVVRVARNHPLPDGNKRLAWQSLTMFCALNGRGLDVSVDDAVEAMLAIAAGEWDELTSVSVDAYRRFAGWPPCPGRAPTGPVASPYG